MDAENEREGGEFWMKFFVVGGVVGLAWLFTSLGMGVGRGNGRKKE